MLESLTYIPVFMLMRIEHINFNFNNIANPFKCLRLIDIPSAV
jgi:hypothetical protein